MGRGRGKGKKQNAGDDAENGEEEKLIAHNGRGRPQKTLNNGIEEDEETEKIEVNVQYAKNSITNEGTKDIGTFDNGRKRKRSSQIEENSNAIDEESGSGAKSSTLTDDSIKPIGFRQNGNRRKGKPRRAAEAGVECS